MSEGWDPRGWGAQHIPTSGEHDAWTIAESDANLDAVIRDPQALQDLANERFEVFWQEQRATLVTISHRDPSYNRLIERFDHEDIGLARRLFAGGFAKGYKDKIKQLGTGSPNVHVVRARHSDDMHLYEIELRDSLHLPKAVRFEVVVSDYGDAELQELD